eukprot:g5036.t1
MASDAEDHAWMISAVVTLWNSVECLVDEDSSAEYVRLVNELRGGENSPGPARAPSDRDKALKVVEKAETALEALGSGENFTTAALRERLEEIRAELMGVLAECNVTEDDMRPTPLVSAAELCTVEAHRLSVRSMTDDRKAAAKLRATAYATTSRALMTGAQWLGAINDEDLVLQSNNRKADEARRAKLRREQRLREMAAVEAKRIEKQKIRDERERKRIHQEELEREASERREMEKEERAQRSSEEARYCMTLLRRFPLPGRQIDDIRSLLLKFRRDRAKIEEALIQDRANRVSAHVRWRRRALESIWETLRAANREQKRGIDAEDLNEISTHSNRFRNHRQKILTILQRDEKFRRDLMLWPTKVPQDQSPTGYYQETLENIPEDAVTNLLDLSARPNEDRLIHLCCKETCGGTASLNILLGAGASLSIANERGIQAIHLACQAGCLSSVAKLLASGADGRARISTSGNTPVFIAIENNNFPLVKYLFHVLGIDALRDRNARGVTPLHLMAYYGYSLMVEQMLCWLTRGRKVVVVDSNSWEQSNDMGFYRVPGSVEGKRQGLASGFLMAEAEKRGLRVGSGGWKEKPSKLQHNDVNRSVAAVTERGVTPLMCAAWSRHTDIMGMLSLHMTTEEMALKDTRGYQAKDYARCGHRAIEDRKSDAKDEATSESKTRWILDPLL